MVMPYLHFNGNCEEAFNMYADAFGGSIESLSRYGNNPNNKVMHAQVMLTKTGGVSGSDQSDEEGPIQILEVEILVHLPSREKLEDVVSKLSVGGAVTMDFTPNPPPDDSSGCAIVRDRFGYVWILCANA